jgi:hypothetical protein
LREDHAKRWTRGAKVIHLDPIALLDGDESSERQELPERQRQRLRHQLLAKPLAASRI